MKEYRKNKLNIRGHEFYLYDIYDIDKHRYMMPNERLNFISNINIQHVPIVNSSKIFQKVKTMDVLLEYAKL